MECQRFFLTGFNIGQSTNYVKHVQSEYLFWGSEENGRAGGGDIVLPQKVIWFFIWFIWFYLIHKLNNP